MSDHSAHRTAPLPAARDLAAEAEVRTTGRQTFLRHVFTRLPLVSAFVITINLFVQVRGDVGLAVAIAQNLTFGAIAVIVLLNLVIYIMVGVMVALMPMVFDPDFNRWVRIVGGRLSSRVGRAGHVRIVSHRATASVPNPIRGIQAERAVGIAPEPPKYWDMKLTA